MKLKLSHQTIYVYDGVIIESMNEVRLRPASTRQQICVSFTLHLNPSVPMYSYQDYYGNTVHYFSVTRPHNRLEITAESHVITQQSIDEAEIPPGERTLGELRADESFFDEHAEFLVGSQYVSLDSAIESIATGQWGDPKRLVLPTLHEISEYIYREYIYEKGATDVSTTVTEFIEHKRGVCQDFVHVMIAFCRCLGIPARYVSGYLGSTQESEASHAWVEAFLPGYGWLAFDPTHNSRPNEYYIQVAIGRDYADVTLIHGTYKGASNSTFTSRVSVQPITTPSQDPLHYQYQYQYQQQTLQYQYQQQSLQNPYQLQRSQFPNEQGQQQPIPVQQQPQQQQSGV